MRNAARLVLFAQLSLFSFLFICLLLIPHFLFETNEGGVSNYGTYTKTVIPYTFGFVLCSVLTTYAALSIPKDSAHRSVRWALYVLGAVYLLELLSTYPYKISDTFDNIHMLVNIAAALYSMVVATWLALSVARNRVNFVLLGLQYLGFVIALLTYLGYLDVLFIAEFSTSAAFGVLLVRAVGEVSSNAKPTLR